MGDEQKTPSDKEVLQEGLPDFPPLVNFEVNTPPRFLPDDKHYETTKVKLIYRSFGNSYYDPSILDYSLKLLPASFRDPKKWVSLALEQYGTSRGRQFDRLGSVFLGNSHNGLGVEIWRTDNPEPVNTTGGIVWTTTKDVSKYYNLFQQDGSLMFDYPNIVNDVYTGALNITLSLIVHQLKDAPYTSTTLRPLHERTALVYPISKRSATSDSKWAVPGEKAVSSFAIPKNARQAVVEVYASGTANDEFWYSNLNDDIYSQIKNASSLGINPRGPYRELRLHIDGSPAGIAAPYPVIFTGGLNPALWRQQAAFGAFDQPTYIFDVTAFLGVLSDGKPHQYELNVVSAEMNTSIPDSWFVSGNLQVLLSKEEGVTQGGPPKIEVSSRGSHLLSGSVTGDPASKEGVITNYVKMGRPRTLSLSASLQLPGQTSAETQIRTSHAIAYDSSQTLTDATNRLKLTQTVKGSQLPRRGSATILSQEYSYPLKVNLEADEKTLNVSVDHSYVLNEISSLLPTSIGSSSIDEDEPDAALELSISTHQVAEAHSIVQDGSLISGIGITSQKYKYLDSEGFTFEREVAVNNRTVTRDDVGGTLKDQAGPVQ